MKKRRMKLMALMLAVTVTFTSVVPVGAAGNADEGQMPQVQTEAPQTEDAVPQTTDTDSAPVTDAGQNETVPEDKGETIPEVPEEGGEASEESQIAVEYQGDGWFKGTDEEVPGAVVYYHYNNVPEGTEPDTLPDSSGLVETWIYGPVEWEGEANPIFIWEKLDGPEMTEVPLQEGRYLVGKEKDQQGKLVEVYYWLTYSPEYPTYGMITKDKWVTDGEHFYYFSADGRQDLTKTGLQKIGDDTYYLAEDGKILVNDSVVVDGKKYYFGADGKCENSYVVHEEKWMKNSKGWWYQKEDGTWPANCFYEIKGVTYYFDGSGYMVTGWKMADGKWYYFNTDGSMAKGWALVKGKWYYLESDGIMKTGWYQVDGKWYYSDGNGAMKTGWQKIGGVWYYLTGSGAMATGWQKIGSSWYYLKDNGAMVTGWLNLNGVWYYLTGSGAMATGWQKVGATWYYLNGSGAMATGWISLGGKWYYLTPSSGAMKTGWYQVSGKWYYSYASGVMAANAWVDTYYYVGSNGAMVTNQNINGYYVGSDGKWIPGYGTVNVNTEGNWEKGSSGEYYFKKANGSYAKNEYVAWNKNWYYLNANGVMLTGWNYIKGYKMYFDGSGRLCQDVSPMVGGPYMIRVNRTKCQITIFAQDGSKGWTIPVKSITCSVGNPITLTPTGRYYIGAQARWTELMGPSWGQWTSHVVQGIYIHSVAGSANGQYNLSAAQYNLLGQPASHGCIRVCVRDAKWIYDHCKTGTRIDIGDNYFEPFDKPATIKISGNNVKDPTDIWNNPR